MSDLRVQTPFGWKEAKGTNEGVLVVTDAVGVRSNMRRIAAAGNYDAEEILSNSATDGQGTPWEFNDIGNIGRIHQAQVFIQTTALTPRITLYLYSRKPTTELDDNAANAGPSIGDLSFYIGKIDFPAMEDLGGVSESLATVSTYGNLPLVYWGCENKLLGIAVTRDAITGETANDFMLIRLIVEKL